MNKTDLINKIKLYLDKNSIESSIGSQVYVSEFTDALLLFMTNISEEIFLKVLRVLQYTFTEKSNNTDYITAKNAMFGEFNDIRNTDLFMR